jgi:hypothetical protein
MTLKTQHPNIPSKYYDIERNTPTSFYESPLKQHGRKGGRLCTDNI